MKTTKHLKWIKSFKWMCIQCEILSLSLSLFLTLILSHSPNWIMITVSVIVYRSPPVCKHNIDAPHDTMFSIIFTMYLLMMHRLDNVPNWYQQILLNRHFRLALNLIPVIYIFCTLFLFLYHHVLLSLSHILI